MDSPSDIFITSTNYFLWKYHMEDVLKSKGVYHITLRKEKSPADDEKIFKWVNKNDGARGLFGLSISHNLQFQLQGIDNLDEARAHP
jgi:hypothetical protein